MKRFLLFGRLSILSPGKDFEALLWDSSLWESSSNSKLSSDFSIRISDRLRKRMAVFCGEWSCGEWSGEVDPLAFDFIDGASQQVVIIPCDPTFRGKKKKTVQIARPHACQVL